jgi:hypothetical protein
MASSGAICTKRSSKNVVGQIHGLNRFSSIVRILVLLIQIGMPLTSRFSMDDALLCARNHLDYGPSAEPPGRQ